MAMNDMTISQAATLLNAMVKQATGQTAQATIANPQDLVSVAQVALKTGKDPLFNAISQVWSDTIFATRVYNAPLSSLEWTIGKYGNAIRKLSPIAREMTDDAQFKWPVAYDAVNHSDKPFGNGESVDMWKIAKQDVLQTNFYGTAVYMQEYTVFRKQLMVAFNSGEELMRYNAMMLQERMNDKESFKESVARGLQLNFIAGIIDEASDTRVVHLLTEYNALTGLSLDQQSVYQPENYPSFIRWMYARINNLCDLMAARSNVYQTNITGKTILRHTPKNKLRVAINSNFLEQMQAMALPVTFNTNTLELPKYEAITYWQSIDKPMAIDITPVYTDTSGGVKTGSQVTEQMVVGLLHDVDAIGYAQVDPWSSITPLNSKGGYWNEFYHASYKTISDNTEKAVVLLLD